MNEQLITIIGSTIAALFGGSGGAALLIRFKEVKLKQQGDENDRLLAENVRLRGELGEERKGRHDCEERLNALERRVEVVEHHHTSYLARWIKDSAKRITWINNQALITIFAPLGYSRVDVVGRTFTDLLDPDAVAEIDRLDRAALALPGRAASSMLQLHHSLPVMIIVKVAGIGRDSELIYEGYAYNPNDPADVQARGERRQQEQRGASQLMLSGPESGDAATS